MDTPFKKHRVLNDSQQNKQPMMANNSNNKSNYNYQNRNDKNNNYSHNCAKQDKNQQKIIVVHVKDIEETVVQVETSQFWTQ